MCNVVLILCNFFLFFVVLDSETEIPSRKEVVSYVKRAGPLLLGPQLCTSPVKCLSHCLARKDKSDEFYTVKVSKKSQKYN